MYVVYIFFVVCFLICTCLVWCCCVSFMAKKDVYITCRPVLLYRSNLLPVPLPSQIHLVCINVCLWWNMSSGCRLTTVLLVRVLIAFLSWFSLLICWVQVPACYKAVQYVCLATVVNHFLTLWPVVLMLMSFVARMSKVFPWSERFLLSHVTASSVTHVGCFCKCWLVIFSLHFFNFLIFVFAACNVRNDNVGNCSAFK